MFFGYMERSDSTMDYDSYEILFFKLFGLKIFCLFTDPSLGNMRICKVGMLIFLKTSSKQYDYVIPGFIFIG